MRRAALVLATLFCVLTTLSCSNAQTKTPLETPLAQNGKALMPIVIAPRVQAEIDAAADIKRAKTPDEKRLFQRARQAELVRDTAQSLAKILGQISGATYQVQTGDGTTGIAIGTAADFPALDLAKQFQPNDPTKREDYVLRSRNGGVLLIGATGKGASHAAWDFLHRLGYRQFFPGENWEVVPHDRSLSIAVDATESPDYYARRIWFTYGTWDDNEERMAQWSIKNRATSGVTLNTGHAYNAIINRNLEEFEKHPEYLTKPATNLKKGDHKFCVSNTGLQQLVIDDALKFFEENPDADSYSVDPSDGGGWESETCDDAAKIGSPSNRVLTLANVVAEAVEKKYPGKRIAFYAYNDHSPPPTIKVHPNVVVSIATAFIKGGFSIDQLVEGWQKQGRGLGRARVFQHHPLGQRFAARRARFPDRLFGAHHSLFLPERRALYVGGKQR